MRTKKNNLQINSDKGTFIVEIKSCQNQTWQGSITWVEAKRKENFRSALELLRMIDSVIEIKD